MKRLIWVLAFLLCISVLADCGLSNVVNRGEYVDQKSVQTGTPRKECLARFGSPIDSRVDESGCKCDIFRVPQGDTTGGKAAKGAGIFVADVLTLGLTEIIFSPVTDGKQYVTFEVLYDKDDKVRQVNFIQK